MPKYIFVTGGVVSSVGKGITTAALGRILKSRNISVSIQKLDPYLNVDPGTMSPYQHGEVFVTSDGAETDLDLGHYERFIDEELTKASSVTTGQIYQAVIAKERRGDFLGGTIQAIPHVTNEIKAHVARHRPRYGAGGDHRSRRHGRRHRGPAVPRGDPPDAPRGAPRGHAFDPRHVPAARRLHERAEDQADAALGARTAQRTASSRTSSSAARDHEVTARPAPQDRAVLRRRGARRHLAADGATASTRCRSSSRTRTSATTSSSCCSSTRRRATSRSGARWSSGCRTRRAPSRSPSSASTSSCTTRTSRSRKR